MPNTPIQIPNVNFEDVRDPIWGDSYNWSFVRKFSQIQKLAIHHSVTSPNATYQDIALLHKARGWGGIGYHFLIIKGKVFYVGDILTGRANIGGNNEKIIGICIVDDHTKNVPLDSNIFAAHDLCEFFMKNYPPLQNINDWNDVMGHQDAYKLYKWTGAEPTACPDDNWRPGLFEAIRDRKSMGNHDITPSANIPSTPIPVNGQEEMTTKRQAIKDVYQALTGKDPSDSTLAWRLSQGMNLRDIIIDICMNDAEFRFKGGNIEDANKAIEALKGQLAEEQQNVSRLQSRIQNAQNALNG